MNLKPIRNYECWCVVDDDGEVKKYVVSLVLKNAPTNFLVLS